MILFVNRQYILRALKALYGVNYCRAQGSTSYTVATFTLTIEV